MQPLPWLARRAALLPCCSARPEQCSDLCQSRACTLAQSLLQLTQRPAVGRAHGWFGCSRGGCLPSGVHTAPAAGKSACPSVRVRAPQEMHWVKPESLFSLFFCVGYVDTWQHRHAMAHVCVCLRLSSVRRPLDGWHWQLLLREGLVVQCRVVRVLRTVKPAVDSI